MDSKSDIAEVEPRESRRERHTATDCRACWDVLEMCIRDVDRTIQYVVDEGHLPPRDVVKRLSDAMTKLIREFNAAKAEQRAGRRDAAKGR